MTRASLVEYPWYPAGIGAVFVLSVFAQSTAALAGVWRPLLVVPLAALALQILLVLTFRHRHLGSALAATLLIAVIGYPELALGLAGLLGFGAVWVVAKRRRLTSLPWGLVTRSANLVVLILAAIAASTVVGALSGPTNPLPALGAGRLDRVPPDIIVVVLDGYPRSDTLLEDFELDSGSFHSRMESLGFDVAVNSHSNYNMTLLTLASMLNGTLLDDLVPEPPRDVPGQYRAVTAAINSGRFMDLLRNVGYEIVSIPSPFTNAALTDADRVIDDGGVTEFELALAQLGGIRLLLPDLQRAVFVDSHRDRVRHTFSELSRLALENADQPRFILAHVMAPHPPYVFSGDGRDAAPFGCYPLECSLWDHGERYGDEVYAAARRQIEFVNAAVLDFAETIQSAGGDHVVVIMSDHGHRHDKQDRIENVRSLFMARTPDGSLVFPDDVSPVNVLPRIANVYLGTEIELAEETSYWVDIDAIGAKGLLSFEEVSVP